MSDAAQTRTGGETRTIEVSHEALIREWKRLNDWLRNAREGLLLMKRIAFDAGRWIRKGRPDEELYHGRRLREAQDWAAANAPSAEEEAFISASAAYEQAQIAAEERRKEELNQAAERAERQRRRAQIALTAVIMVIVLALVVGVWAVLGVNAASQLGATAQAGATQVAADAAYFGLRQERIATLAAGGVVAPLGTGTPEPTQYVATLTQVALLNQWKPLEMTDEHSVEMVQVPTGCFFMGSVIGADEQPVNIQCFDQPFWIDKFEVWNAQYRQLSGQEPPSMFSNDLNPVEHISWFDARDFCKLRGGRLPTEAEWEYAARGPNSLTYPWGNTFIESAAVYNRRREDGPLAVMDNAGQPLRPVGASWVGAVDMAGNVWEWTSTIFDDMDYSRQVYDLHGLYPCPYATNDGRENDESTEVWGSHLPVYTIRVVRGGSFNDTDSFLLSAFRDWFKVFIGSYDFFGFRCVRSEQP